MSSLSSRGAKVSIMLRVCHFLGGWDWSGASGEAKSRRISLSEMPPRADTRGSPPKNDWRSAWCSDRLADFLNHCETKE